MWISVVTAPKKPTTVDIARMGGNARAASLTPSRRREIAAVAGRKRQENWRARKTKP